MELSSLELNAYIATHLFPSRYQAGKDWYAEHQHTLGESSKAYISNQLAQKDLYVDLSPDDKHWLTAEELPPYSTSLVACAEMEEEIERQGMIWEYVNALIVELNKDFPNTNTLTTEGYWKLLHLSPLQRARACVAMLQQREEQVLTR